MKESKTNCFFCEGTGKHCGKFCMGCSGSGKEVQRRGLQKTYNKKHGLPDDYNINPTQNENPNSM